MHKKKNTLKILTTLGVFFYWNFYMRKKTLADCTGHYEHTNEISIKKSMPNSSSEWKKNKEKMNKEWTSTTKTRQKIPLHLRVNECHKNIFTE